MKRREFIKLTAVASAATLLGCEEKREPVQSDAGDAAADTGPDLPRRSELMKLDGLTSIHDHLDSERAAEMMLEAMDRTGIARMNLLGCYKSVLHSHKEPDWDSKSDNNDLLLRLIEKHPERFTAFVLMDGLEPDPVAVLKDYLSRGAHGVKMYNGVYKGHRAMGIDDARLVPLFRFCELHGVPVLIHVDPPRLAEFFSTVRDYPALPWICPHLLVRTGPTRIEQLAVILRRYPNLCTDMSFGFEGWMHANLKRLSETRNRAREIFIRHADQIMFGTDIVFALNRSHRTVDWATNSYTEYRKLLEFDRFHHRVVAGKRVYEDDIDGLALPEDVLQKIYVENPRRFLDRPRPGFDRDDLDTVHRALPQGARLDPQGDSALLAVAAVATLSEIDGIGGSAKRQAKRVATTRDLAHVAAETLGVDRATLEIEADADALRDLAAGDPDAVAILPLAEMDPRLRALPLEGVDPCLPGISRCATAGEATRNAYFGEYPLLIPLAIDADDDATRFDPHEIRTVAMTGTSLLGDGMISEPPAASARTITEEIAALFQSVDVAHVSIENPLTDPCEQDLKRWRFCFEEDQLEALDYLNVDVIELTGNHLLDRGQSALKKTLKAYRGRGIPYYGGGENLKRALAPTTVTIRGLKFGFVGVNRLYDERRSVARDRAGALVPTGDRFERVLSETKAASDVMLLTYQGGYEFSPTPYDDMLRFAHRAIDAGASGAFGTHAHLPMGIEVYRDGFVGYGLGNLLFRHPRTVSPKNMLTECGIVALMSFYGDELLQTSLAIVRYDGPAIRPVDAREKSRALARVRGATRPSLRPRRSIPELTDASVEIEGRKSTGRIWLSHVRVGVTDMLITLDPEAAKAAGSAESALRSLGEVRENWAKRGTAGLRLAVPLLPGWTLPKGEFDAIRISVGDQGFEDLVAEASKAGVPLQIKLTAESDLERIAGCLAKGIDVPLIVAGLPVVFRERSRLATLLGAHRRLYIDTSASTHRAFEAWFDDIEADIAGWRGFFERHADRILAGSGTSTAVKRLGTDHQPRFLKCLHVALDEPEFQLPVFSAGHRGEWGGYSYRKEQKRKGLDLPPEVADEILFGNYARLFPARPVHKGNNTSAQSR
jgi:poly-gamma-glutamate capsule biosynthesis protein CapA/YwtB (metallophosphatase superfamily)/predicted TIM-barrel fold metal-dependent hydrolase